GAAMARRGGGPEELLDEVRLAVGEACSRAVQLHERHGIAEPVVLTLVDDDDRFEVVVYDTAPTALPAEAGPGGGPVGGQPAARELRGVTGGDGTPPRPAPGPAPGSPPAGRPGPCRRGAPPQGLP